MPADNILDAQSEASDASSWGDIDDNDEGESEALIVSLFDERVFTDAMSMISYCKESYNFDFLATRDRLSLDFYGSIKLINFSTYPLLATHRICLSLIAFQFARAFGTANLYQAR